jgi:hypothetical protein
MLQPVLDDPTDDRCRPTGPSTAAELDVDAYLGSLTERLTWHRTDGGAKGQLPVVTSRTGKPGHPEDTSLRIPVLVFPTQLEVPVPGVHIAAISTSSTAEPGGDRDRTVETLPGIVQGASHHDALVDEDQLVSHGVMSFTSITAQNALARYHEHGAFGMQNDSVGHGRPQQSGEPAVAGTTHDDVRSCMALSGVQELVRRVAMTDLELPRHR